MVKVRANPFFLNDEQAKWVEDTLASMTLEEKVGQVFCPMGFTSEDGPLQHDVCQIGVGGMMYRPGAKHEIQAIHRKIQDMAKIPPAAGCQYRGRRQWSGL